jgi:hypothetical protein
MPLAIASATAKTEELAEAIYNFSSISLFRALELELAIAIFFIHSSN